MLISISYVVSWQKAVDGLKVEGVVEYKSLPSGLHNVEEDLIYFTNDKYIGVSAFVRQDDPEVSRNASMLAVGVLLPLDTGRMGKSWLHAPKLKQLAREQQGHITDYGQLEAYWEQHKIEHESIQSPATPHTLDEGYQHPRALGIVNNDTSKHVLPSHHPALALPDLLETFGPLIFPVFRAVLLRKRILILGETPVELTCGYVYNMSLLASLPQSISSFVPVDTLHQLRSKPLFNVGISDIDTIASLESNWIACTTDDVLCSKPHLFDLLIILPPASPSDSSGMQKYAGSKRYPKLIISTPELAKAYPKRGLKATQRDAKRYQALKHGLHSLPTSSIVSIPAHDGLDGPRGEDAKSTQSIVSNLTNVFEAVEPLGWPLAAYHSMVWWLSSGDSKSGLSAADELEDEQDRSLLQESLQDKNMTKEIATVAYFHRLSNLMFAALSQAVKRSTPGHPDQARYRDEPTDGDGDGANESETQALLDRDGDDDDDDNTIDVSEDDIRAMGLDVWSNWDRQFIAEMVRLWWDREATVRGGHIECCGWRII